jgi:hypothetical protein
MGNTPEATVEVSLDDAEDDKFKLLENELEIEKNNSTIQAEKINTLKSEVAEMIAKIEEL